jgi:hypothetical protein
MPNDTQRTLPLRALWAALALGAAGCAVARAIAVMLANISVPSFERAVLPVKFAYGTPPDWSGSTIGVWTLAIIGVLFFPFLFNRTWFSRRVASVAGIIKLVAAALLVVIVGAATLTGGDLFARSPWGSGAGLPLLGHLGFGVVAGLCGGALFALFGEGMASGAPDRWFHPGVPRAAVQRAFASGFLAAVVIALLAFVAADALATLFQALTGFLGESAEVSPLGWRRLDLALALGLGLLSATGGALLVALSPGPTDRARRLASIAVAAVPAVALVALSLWFKEYCRTTGEMGTTFAQAAGLESAPKPRLMVLPGPRVYQYPMEIAVPGLEAEVVGATSRNIELAQQYLRRLAGRWTVHTVPAWHLAAYVHERLLEPETALRERSDAAEATGSLLSTAVLVGKLPRMPRSDAVRGVSARLLDPAHFTSGAQARAKLQDSLVRYDRSVTGAIELPPLPPPPAGQRQGTRVALYRQSDGRSPSVVPSAIQLVAATTPDAQGRFAFEGLPPAFYAVGVLLPESLGADPGRVTVQGALRVVDLSKDRLRDSAGTIRVSSR